MKQEGIKLIADKGKVLYCTFLESNYGREVSLGYVYYDKDGVLLKEPYLLEAKDFEDITDPQIKNPEPNYFGLPERGFTYADAKAAVVKVYYSYDDQIALMLNYAKNPEQYQAAYGEMQAWRDIAGEVAKKLIGEE